MDIITEKREAIDVSGKTAVLSLKMLRKILAGDKVAIKRVQDAINAEEEYNYGSKKDLVTRVLKKPELFKSKIDKKKDMSLAKADKILQIRMTSFYALLKSKLNLEDSDIRERGDWADKPNSNFYVRSSIEFPKSDFGLDVEKKKRDIECGKIRQIIGSTFKEGRGYWNVLFDSSSYETKHDGKKYCQLHVIFDIDKYKKEVLLGKRFEQVSSKKSVETYFSY